MVFESVLEDVFKHLMKLDLIETASGKEDQELPLLQCTRLLEVAASEPCN